MLAHKQAKERLTRNLSRLSSYCRHGVPAVNDPSLATGIRPAFFDSDFSSWPPNELLREINDDVKVLADRYRIRVIPTFWRTICRLDKKVTTLQLKLRIDNLIGRARDLIPGESELNKVVRLTRAGNILVAPQKLARLLEDDRRMVVQLFKAWPLVVWACVIGHPMAKDLDQIAEVFPTEEEIKARRRREKTRERVRRYRNNLKKSRQKSVTR